MNQLSPVDLFVLVIYLVGVVGFGAWFIRKSGNTEEFMAAGRSLPGWAIGLSIFGTYVSSISFLANPGKSYAANWNPFVFSLTLPFAAWVAVRYFVPFYRNVGEVSAYTHLEHRFGAWARIYAVACYMLSQLARMGTIMYLVALAVAPLTGWDIKTIIIVTGVLVTMYTLMGGIEAVIWTDVVQSIVLTAGALVCVVIILVRMPEGPAQVWEIAQNGYQEKVIGEGDNKFSLGSFDLVHEVKPATTAETESEATPLANRDRIGLGGWAINLAEPTFWVVFIYGIFINLNNFGVDQSYVQRYITAKSDADATRSVWMGAWMYLPISAVLFFIGTSLFAYYDVHPELLPQEVADSSVEGGMRAFDPKLDQDKVFPQFIVDELPTGMTGLLIAAIFAAAMSSVDSSLNGSATLFLRDIYQRFFRPVAAERESMAVLYSFTLFWGAAGTGMALAMINVKSALDAWWQLSGILSGGVLGLFLLGLVSRKVQNPAAIVGAVLGILVIVWMTFSPNNDFENIPQALRSPFHGYMIIVVGTLTILFVGLVVSQLTGSTTSNKTKTTTKKAN